MTFGILRGLLFRKTSIFERLILIIWIFAVPYNIPGQRGSKDTPLDLLKKRFA